MDAKTQSVGQWRGGGTMTVQDQFLIFEVIVNRRGQAWHWRVCKTGGEVVMEGSERNRRAAQYKADRALFLQLLWARYRLTRPSPRRHPTGRTQSSNWAASPRRARGWGSRGMRRPPCNGGRRLPEWSARWPRQVHACWVPRA